jgi:hypothetical protein
MSEESRENAMRGYAAVWILEQMLVTASWTETTADSGANPASEVVEAEKVTLGTLLGTVLLKLGTRLPADW